MKVETYPVKEPTDFLKANPKNLQMKREGQTKAVVYDAGEPLFMFEFRMGGEARVPQIGPTTAAVKKRGYQSDMDPTVDPPGGTYNKLSKARIDEITRFMMERLDEIEDEEEQQEEELEKMVDDLVMNGLPGLGKKQ
jgi:hypothetical protein